MQSTEHWQRVYQTKGPDGVSWFQEHARHSLELIDETGALPGASIIDVGGGASTLGDDLLDTGYSRLTVLDLASAALEAAQARLGPRENAVTWLVGDVTRLELPAHAYDVWHDRAVFHFLTTQQERDAYVRSVLRSVTSRRVSRQASSRSTTMPKRSSKDRLVLAVSAPVPRTHEPCRRASGP